MTTLRHACHWDGCPDMGTHECHMEGAGRIECIGVKLEEILAEYPIDAEGASGLGPMSESHLAVALAQLEVARRQLRVALYFARRND